MNRKVGLFRDRPQSLARNEVTIRQPCSQKRREKEADMSKNEQKGSGVIGRSAMLGVAVVLVMALPRARLEPGERRGLPPSIDHRIRQHA